MKFLLLQLFFPVFWALECYDSTYPTPDRAVVCPRPNMYCYSEYYAVNRSGVLRPYHDRFCVDKKHCLSRNIYGCKTLDQLAHKVQKAFIKFHVRAQESEIVQTQFCCCDDDLCNGHLARWLFLPLVISLLIIT